MPNTPKKGLPYPSGTDKVRDNPAAVQALATAVDNLPIIKAVSVSVNFDANNRATITFATAFPTACAAVTVDQGGTYNSPYGPIGPFMVETMSTTAFTVRSAIGNLTGVVIRYIAVGS